MTQPDAKAFRELSRTRDSELRNLLVEEHLPLAKHLARRFSHRGESLDDLIQVASLALVRAVDRYDPDQGTEFSTFAVPTVMGELKRHFRDRGWAMRVPRRLQELHLELGTIRQQRTQELGRPPTVTELAEAASVDEQRVLEALEAGASYQSTSLDALSRVDDADATSLADRIPDRRDDLVDAERRVALEPLLATLSHREQTILRYRFVDGLTQSEIAERLDISQMHVSRLLSRTLAELRTRADDSIQA